MKRETTDWAALERIEARLRDEKARLARLEQGVNADRVDLERIAREMSESRKSPVLVEVIGGIVVMLSIAIIMLGMMLLP